MSLHLSKRSLVKNTMKVGGLTFLSRILGLIRDVFLARFFGVGALSDAFVVAFRIPNTFRHIFAEGAMSASFVPAFVKSVKEGGREESNGLMTISFLFFEGIILCMYAFVLFKTEWVIKLLAPGYSSEQVAYAVPFLRVLFPFLLLVSSSSLLAGALQAVNHFFAPAFGVPLWNMVYIGALLLAMTHNLSAMVVCGGILLGGLVQFLLNLYCYFKQNFSFGAITPQVKTLFKDVLTKFCPCLFGASIVELNNLVSGMVASYLPKGSVSLLYYGSRFMNVTLGVFAVALTSVLLPHFSRVVLYAPRRLNFYILETVKIISWVVLPVVLLMTFFSKSLFSMVLFSKSGTQAQAAEAGGILVIYLVGLLFLCLNKVLLSVFYSLKDTWSTTKTSGVCALVNLCGDVVGMFLWGTYGIAGAASLSGIVMTFLCFYFLHKRHGFTFYSGNYFNFLGRYVTQLAIAGIIFLTGYYTFMTYVPWATHPILYWVFAGAWSLVLMGGVFLTRKYFGLKVYFLSK